MMQWEQLLTPKRLGQPQSEDLPFQRTPFLRDYDRLIFSSALRRLKDKTQVFALAKNDYVRTRLIHSLEVSCVGRSLGRIIGEQVIQRHHLKRFNASDFGDILAAACLAHDIGNPPFGHAGEDAIRAAFLDWYSSLTAKHQPQLTDVQFADFEWFEGNATGFRILTRRGMRSQPGGLQLTCPTLAAFTKYPRESWISPEVLQGYSGKSVQKYGFFQTEKTEFTQVAETIGLIQRHPDVAWWARHPLAFLVEAADDICYSIVDIEDSFYMGYVPFTEAKSWLLELADIDSAILSGHPRDQIKQLRAQAINQLIWAIAEIFLDHESDILAGRLDRNLLYLSLYAPMLKTIEAETYAAVFHHPDVASVNVSGFAVLGRLFTEFATALFVPSAKGALLLNMLPSSYRPQKSDHDFEKLLKVTDYIAGMTDAYAMNLYQKLQGIATG